MNYNKKRYTKKEIRKMARQMHNSIKKVTKDDPPEAQMTKLLHSMRKKPILYLEKEVIKILTQPRWPTI